MPPSTTSANTNAQAAGSHSRRVPRDSIMIRNTKQQSKRLLNEEDLNEDDSGPIATLVRNLSFSSLNSSSRHEEASSILGEPAEEETKTEEENQENEHRGNNNELPPTSPRKSKVHFGKAEYHQHAMIVGDNPACSVGVPITIEWRAFDHHTMDLHKDTGDMSGSSEHRSYLEMRVPPSVRDQICRSAGFSRSETVRLCKPVNIARAQRVRTVETLSLGKLQEALERAKKGLKKVVLSKEEREERARLKEWRKPHHYPHLQRQYHSEPHIRPPRSSITQGKDHRSMPLKCASLPDMDDSNTTRASTQPGDLEDQRLTI